MEEKYLHAAGQEAVKSSLYPANQGLREVKPLSESFAVFDRARHGSGLSLGKDERLSRESLLHKLFDEGKSISHNGFTLVYLVSALPTFYPAQAAFSVAKRNFKKASDRNRIKRLLREAYRNNKLPLYDKLSEKGLQVAMMLIYKGRGIPDHEVVEKNVAEILQKMEGKLR